MSSVPEAIIADVFARLPVDVDTAIGRSETETLSRPKRVVAVPLGAQTIDATDSPGFQEFEDDVGKYRARRIAIRRFDISFYCHDTTFESCENLYLDVFRAVRLVTHNSVSFSSEVWIDQQEGDDGLDRFGRAIVFTATVSIPILSEKHYLTTAAFVTDCGD